MTIKSIHQSKYQNNLYFKNLILLNKIKHNFSDYYIISVQFPRHYETLDHIVYDP
ncbi:hypothetical protein C1645_397689 [Glomus cerebriforme]|uniref:Uncharacterized protein n=1 Tax=Glomus cerebriforme TaxID=658196 RepID=A0A397SLD0_9GLOM|nr:hypothetical protein C1645_397689 [Glomus cerebriforme]